MKKTLKTALATGLLALASGCANLIEAFHIDNVRTGIVYREIRGGSAPFKFRRLIPLIRAQANREVKDNLDVYVRFDYIQGDIGASSSHLSQDLYGNMQSLGAGISYFPFSENLSFDFGGEIFHASGGLESRLGQAGINFRDSAFGCGINTGVTFEYPLSDNISIYAGGGYNATFDTCNDVDFDGYYAGAGIVFNLP